MAKMTTENNKWILNQTISAAGTSKKTFETAGNFVDKNIEVNTTVNNATLNYTTDTKGTVTPSVSISSGTTYGFTTSQPVTGTYLTLDPDATITTPWKAKYQITSPGFISAGTTYIQDSPDVASGTNYYVPVATITLSGGAISTDKNTNTITTTPTVTLNTNGSFTTASGYGFTKTQPSSGTEGVNYFKIDGTLTKTTGKATSSVNVSTSPITYSNSAGVISGHSDSASNYTGVAKTNISKDVDIVVDTTDNFDPYYIPVTTLNFGNTGGVEGSTTTDVAITGMSYSTTTPSNYYVKATATGSAHSLAVLYNNEAGVIAKNTNAVAKPQSQDINIGSESDTYYIPEAQISRSGGTLSGTGYTKKPDITIANGSDTTFESGSYSLGDISSGTYPYYYKIKASTQNYTGNTKVTLSARTETITAGYLPGGSQTALASGEISPSVTIQANSGTIYLNLKKATVGASSVITGIDEYFNTTSSNPNLKITPTYSVSAAGYAPSETASGTTLQYAIKSSSVNSGVTTVNGQTATRGTFSWSKGWTLGTTLPTTTFSNTATNGRTYVDISATTAAPELTSSGYLYINSGYSDNLRISLAKLIPDNVVNVTASSQLLNGISAFDGDGNKITGNIPTKTSGNISNNGYQYFVPAGYYAEDVTITLPEAKVKSGSGTISSLTYTYDSTNTRFNINGSTTIPAPSVEQQGFVSSTKGEKLTNSATVSTTINRIAISGGLSATGARKPVIAKASTTVNGATNLNNSIGTVSTNVPSSGYYISVQSPANTYAITATPTVINSGLGTTSYYSGVTSQGTVGASASDMTYIVIPSAVTTGSVSANSSITSVDINYDSGTGKFNLTRSQNITGSGSITTSTQGWLGGNISIPSGTVGTASVNVSLNKVGVGFTSGGSAKVSPTISRTNTTATGATNVGSYDASTEAPSSGYFISVQSAAKAANLTINPKVTTAGYGTTSVYTENTSGTISIGANASSVTYIKIAAAATVAEGADVLLDTADGSNAGVNISSIVGTKVTTEPTSGYYLSFKGSGNNKVTTAGWIESGSLTSATSQSKYFPIASGNVTVTPYTLSVSEESYNIVGSVGIAETTTTDTNMSNYTIGAKDTTNYPYFFKIRGQYNGSSRTITASTTATKDTRTAGYIPARGEQTIIASASKQSTITASNVGSETYIKLKSTTITPNYNNSNLTTYFNTANSGSYNVSITPKYTATAGYTSGGTDVLGTVQYYNIKTAVTAANSADVNRNDTTGTNGTNVNGSLLNTKSSSEPSGVYYISFTGSGNSKGSTAGWLAKDVTTTAASATRYFSLKTAGVATSYANTGMSTYFNSATASSYNVSITPKYTNTAGYAPAVSTAVNSGGVGYWNIKTGSITTPNVTTSNTVTWTSGWIATGGSWNIPSAVYTISGVASSPAGSVTPTISVSNSSTYGFTTTQPTAGTYLTLTPGGSATSGSVTPKLAVTSGGYLAQNTYSGTDVKVTPTVNTGTPQYVPVSTPSVTGGTLDTSSISYTNATGTNVTLVNSSSYSIKFDASGQAIAAQTLFTTDKAGVISKYTNSGAIAQRTKDLSATKTVYVKAGDASVSGGALSITGNQTLSPSLGIASGATVSSGVTLLTAGSYSLGAINSGTYKYYFPIKATIDSKQTTITASGAKVTLTKTEGYIAGGSSDAIASGTKSATVTSNSATQTTYLNLKAAAATVTATPSIASADVKVAKSASGNVSAGTITTTKPSSGYYAAVLGTASGKTTVTKSVGTVGYLASADQITANSATVSNTSGAVWYLPLSGAAATVTLQGSIASGNVKVVKSASGNASTGTITTTKPSSGYYVAMLGTASGSVSAASKTINTSGYLAVNTQITANSATISNVSGAIYYIPLSGAVGKVTLTAGNGACGITSASNVTYASTDIWNNGISVTFTGSGTVSANASITTAGYAPTTMTFTDGGTSKNSNSVTSTQYIKGVTLNKPSSTGTISHFRLTIPNGASDTMTLYFHCDSSGNVTIDDVDPDTAS